MRDATNTTQLHRHWLRNTEGEMWGGLLQLFLFRELPDDDEREADFFEPVQYPTMDQVEARRMAREYSKQTKAEY